MLYVLPHWLLVAAFAGAGIFNALGTAATQESFARWGYPRWWCRVTGASEIAVSAMIAVPIARSSGLILATAIIAAALYTILRHREWSHLLPLGAFAALIALTALVG